MDAPDYAYDALIVGAGPAGCMAAVRAPGHLRVLLVDRLAMPRDVICGGVLHARVLKMIDPIPLRDDIFSHPRKFNWSLIDGRLGRGGPLTDTAYYNIDRSRFDRLLYETALERNNVDVWSRTAFLRISEDADEKLIVELRRNGRTIRVKTRFLIGADGARSNVRRFAGAPDTAYWSTVQCSLRSEGNEVDRVLAFLNEDIDYYGWVVPKDGNLLVGLGCNAGEGRLREAFDNFRSLLEERYSIFGSESGRLRSRNATRLRSWRELYPGKGRILLTGEAAGLICPWSGEGISGAVLSGSLAGSLLSLPSPLSRYRRLLRLQIPRRIFDQTAYQTMIRPWACWLVALIIPGSEFRPLGNPKR